MIVAVIPALDEEEAVPDVVKSTLPYVDSVVVVDNGSHDRTAERAAQAGAIVQSEPRRGYGFACLAGVGRATELGADVLVFLDADGSDNPNDLPRLIAPIRRGEAELVLGVRTPDSTEPGSMTNSQQFGNWLAPKLMQFLVGARYSDMPPQKAIQRAAFERLRVKDTGHGFTIELLLKAHTHGLVTREVEVGWRRRAGGQSKVSGTVRGSVRAGAKILTTIARHAWLARRA